MLSSDYLLNDICAVLLDYADTHQLQDNQLAQTLHSYGPNKPLTKSTWLAHLHQLSELSNNPAIGLDIGQMIKLEHFGVLGYLALSCANLAEVFIQFERYQKIIYGDNASVEMKGTNIRVSWPVPNEQEDFQKSDEVLISGLAKLIRDITGESTLTANAIGFRHDKPPYHEKYQTILGIDMEFNCETFYVEFPIGVLATPIVNSTPSLKPLLEKQAASLLDVFNAENQFEQQLQNIILKNLSDGLVGIDEIAKALGMSTRSLQRYFEEHNTSFTETLKKTRKGLALLHLKEGKLSLPDIAFLLGYSEQSAFTRAFKQWYGLSPKQYLKAHLE